MERHNYKILSKKLKKKSKKKKKSLFCYEMKNI